MSNLVADHKDAKESEKTIMMPMGSAVITNSEGKILMLRRSKDSKYAPAMLQLPEGRIEFGETPLQAVGREVKEETGCAFEPIDDAVVGVSTETAVVNGTRYQMIRIAYEGKIKGKPMLSKEHSEFGWFDVEEMIEKDEVMSGVREVLRAWLDGSE